LTEELRTKISQLQSFDPSFSPTFFEVVTAMALLYLKRKKIDIGVIEVGMGGRLDATNIIIPEVSVITSISSDHREFLGNTLKEISCEKAGIIKKGIPVIVSSQVPEVLEVLEERAKAIGTVTYQYGRDFSSVLKGEDITGIYFDYRSNNYLTLHDLYLPLTGEHQMQNASVAIKAVTMLLNNNIVTRRREETREEFFIKIKDGLAAVKWAGRLEMIKDEPSILIDGAHNPSAAVALSRALENTFLKQYKKIIFVLGIMGDKDIEGIMKPLLPLASKIILTSPNYERAATPQKLAAIATSLGFPNVRTAPTVKDAVEMAESLSKALHDSLIVVTGSFYTIGEAKECIGYTGVLTRLRE
jgi:dihydrofolate synthase/folylpolyglutamate synthase